MYTSAPRIREMHKCVLDPCTHAITIVILIGYNYTLAPEDIANSVIYALHIISF